MKKRKRTLLITGNVLATLFFLVLEYKLGKDMDFKTWSVELYNYRNCLIAGNIVCLINLIMLKTREKIMMATSVVMLILVITSLILMP